MEFRYQHQSGLPVNSTWSFAIHSKEYCYVIHSKEYYQYWTRVEISLSTAKSVTSELRLLLPQNPN